jgi:feruloyl-CoA synthase
LPPPVNVAEWLDAGAASHPDRVFLAERDAASPSGWSSLTYAGAARKVDRLAGGLVRNGIGKGTRVAALARNSVALGILQLAALSIGAIFVPVSPAYAQGRRDYELLRSIFALIEPQAVYVGNADELAPALALTPPSALRIVADKGLAALESEIEPDRLYDLRAAVTSSDPAKILLTSGSTGAPKGVINTHGMIGINQGAFAAMWPYLRARPPVMTCWLPWSHTMGGNFSFFTTLANGGSLYIDDGAPTTDGIARTVRNITEVQPTLYANVPRGFDALLPHLEDSAVAAALFQRLDALVFSGAPLPRAIWTKLKALSLRVTGRPIDILTSWGTTETAPALTATIGETDDSASIGLPMPGVTVKLVPDGDLFEARVKGPNVMPGYFRAAELSREAFDDDGFYRTGDALRFVNDADAPPSLFFNGRIAENFKLTTGTWVHVGQLRVAILSALAPLLQDCVLAGEGQDEIGLIAFPNIAGLRAIIPDVADNLADAVIDHRVIAAVNARIAAYNERNPSSSHAVRQVYLDPRPLSVERGEITDKGYVNQRAVLRNRADAIEAMFPRRDQPAAGRSR